MSARVALIGFGEVGRRLLVDLGATGRATIAAWDVKFPDLASDLGSDTAAPVRRAVGAADAVAGADLVISAVTAANTLAAARQAAVGLAPGALFLDLNSAAPDTKRAAASAIAAAGGRYVEAAVMSPIHPRGVASPMLLGGPHGAAFLADFGDLGFAGASVFSTDIGRASAVKLCRSVVIKGMEALLTESLLAARRHGVEAEVLGSLSNLLPHDDWPSLARYMISRSLEHGARRAEEMREAAATVAEAGIEPLLSRAIAERQGRTAGLASDLADDPLAPLAALLDSMLAHERPLP